MSEERACLRDLKGSQLRGQQHTLTQHDSPKELQIPRHDLLK